jgi:hypothetical protein
MERRSRVRRSWMAARRGWREDWLRGTIRNLVFEQWLNERSSCVKQLLIAL